MRRNSGNIHVLQCSERAITCLSARIGHSGVVVEKHIIHHSHWPTVDGSLQRALVEFVEKYNLSNGRVITILPRHSATVRVLEFPSHDPEEIKGMVELSADDLVPFGPEEIVVSSCIIKRLPNEQAHVLAAVVHRDVLDEHLALYQGAGLAPERIYLSTACMLAALEYPTAHGDGTMLYAHTTADSLEILSLNNGELLYTRGIEIDVSDSEEFAPLLDQTLRGYERETSLNQSLVLHLSSGDKPSDIVLESVREALDFEIAENSMGLRGVTKGVNELNGIPLLEIGAVLLIQKDSPYTIDLLPDSVKEGRERELSKRSLVQNIVMVLLTIALISGAFGQAVYQRNVYRDELDARADALRPQAITITLKRRHLQRLQDQVTRTDTVYEHLARITSQAPKSGLTFSLFDYQYDTGITLQGRADNIDNFVSLIDQLRTVGKSVYPQFAAAHETYSNTKKERDRVVREYSISIPFPDTEENSNE